MQPSKSAGGTHDSPLGAPVIIHHKPPSDKRTRPIPARRSRIFEKAPPADNRNPPGSRCILTGEIGWILAGVAAIPNVDRSLSGTVPVSGVLGGLVHVPSNSARGVHRVA